MSLIFLSNNRNFLYGHIRYIPNKSQFHQTRKVINFRKHNGPCSHAELQNKMEIIENREDHPSNISILVAQIEPVVGEKFTEMLKDDVDGDGCKVMRITHINF